MEKIYQKLKLLPCLLFLFAGAAAIAELSPAVHPQSDIVIGSVADESGAAVAGASVQVKGSQTATISDAAGRFRIDVPDPAGVLVVSYLGYRTQEIAVGGRRTVDIRMVPDALRMQDVVVVGYGSVSKRELTSAVSQVSSENFITGAFTDPLSMIDGKVAGVSISNPNAADPNAAISAQIRGASSLASGNAPLIVLDGVPSVDLRNVSNPDIESVTILKDGSAAAIYGSRASNGVILIETKKGRSGRVSIQYEGYADHDMVAVRPEILSPEEFVERRRGTDFGHKTRWYDELLNKSNIGQNHYLAISGGSDDLVFRASGNYRTKEGLDISSFRKEYGLRVGFSAWAFDRRLEISASLSSRFVLQGNTDYGVFNQALKLNPTQPMFDPARPDKYSILQGYDVYNPVGWLRDMELRQERNLNVADVKLKLTILPGLNTELSMARQSPKFNARTFFNSDHKNSVDYLRKGYAAQNEAGSDDYTLEWIGNYFAGIGRHSFRLMAGYSYQEFNYSEFGAENGDFPSDALSYNSLQSGGWMAKDGRLGMSSFKQREKTIGFPVRFNYSYGDTYFLTASVRYEGNTKFGKSNKWGWFPAVSAAWRLSNLGALKDVRAVDDLKLRASFGSTGRSGFAPYSSMARYAVTGLYGVSSYQDENGEWKRTWGPANNPNPLLRWERQFSYNLGLDFALLGNRLSGSLDAFVKQGKDVISTYPAALPPFMFSQIVVNVGTTRATGMELSLNWDAVKRKDFAYTANLVVANTKSVLSRFSNDIYQKGYTDMYFLPQPGTIGYAQRLKDDTEIGTFWGFRYAGVDPDGNMLVWKDARRGTEKIPATGAASDADMGEIGHGSPRWTMSWGNTFRYRDFDLSLYFQGRFDYSIMNMYQMYYGLTAESGINLLRDAYEKNAHIESGKNVSDYFLEPGDWFSLDNVTLGWSPRLRSGVIGSMRVYASISNVFTLTKFSIMSPKTVEINGLTPGISGLNVYPQARSIMLGVQLSY